LAFNGPKFNTERQLIPVADEPQKPLKR